MQVELSGKSASSIRVASYIDGCGMSVPDKVVTNEYFASYLETSDEWIRDRTGIEERRWTEDGVGASELAESACRDAISQSGVSAGDIDGIIVATVTPDNLFPSTACFLQGRLGITKGPAFDLNAVCSGFVYALTVADGLIVAGRCRNILVVGVDIFSSLVDKDDRSTCVLFGDGAGAVVLRAQTLMSPKTDAGRLGHALGDVRGIYLSELGADGTLTDVLSVPNGSAARPTPESLAEGSHFLRMEGREVFKVAVRKLAEISRRVIEGAGFGVADVDWFVTHQANKRIVLSMAKMLGVPVDKVLVNVDKYGNTSAASIPILLAESQLEGTLKKGDLVVLSAFGGGVTWGGLLLRW